MVCTCKWDNWKWSLAAMASPLAAKHVFSLETCLRKYIFARISCFSALWSTITNSACYLPLIFWELTMWLLLSNAWCAMILNMVTWLYIYIPLHEWLVGHRLILRSTNLINSPLSMNKITWRMEYMLLCGASWFVNGNQLL